MNFVHAGLSHIREGLQLLRDRKQDGSPEALAIARAADSIESAYVGLLGDLGLAEVTVPDSPLRVLTPRGPSERA